MPLPTERDPAHLVATPSDEDCGPAMKRLSDLQRRFVRALTEIDPQNHTRAALIAHGGTMNYNTTKVWACRAMRNEKILAAIREETDKLYRGDGLESRMVILSIMRDPTCDSKTRLRAALELTNRAGHLVETVSRNIVEHSVDRDTKDLLGEIRELARSTGVKDLPVLEGQYEEVETAPADDDISDLLA